jgi:tetratricopeptide (TPR) repeat protein
MSRAALFCVLLLIAIQAAWAGMEDDVARIRQQWERIKYQTPIKAQEDAYEKLAKESAQVMQQYPKQAEPAIWHGIVEASHAGAKGGLGALSLVKSARKSFETALELNPAALHGSAYTSLGSLYYQVPGWPIGFGDEKKALELLRQGLAINPEGIDPNFFLGDYLYRTGDYAGAEQALRKALQAPPREGRTLADEGRRREIAELMEKIRDKKR